MVDDDYLEPVLSTQFHSNLSIAPNGLISGNSKELIALPNIGDQQQHQ